MQENRMPQKGQSMEKSPKAKDIKIETISYLLRDYKKSIYVFCLFVCLRSEAVNSSGILSIQMFPKELTEWILRIALIYTFMRVTLMQITLVLPPMRITFVRSAAQKARLFRFQTHSHLYCTESQIQTY